MIKALLLISVILLTCSCAPTQPPETSQYPRMPDAYRNQGIDKKADRNPVGMSVYDAAETEAEEDYFGVEVVPLEESKRIIEERKKGAAGEKGGLPQSE